MSWRIVAAIFWRGVVAGLVSLVLLVEHYAPGSDFSTVLSSGTLSVGLSFVVLALRALFKDIATMDARITYVLPLGGRVLAVGGVSPFGRGFGIYLSFIF